MNGVTATPLPLLGLSTWHPKVWDFDALELEQVSEPRCRYHRRRDACHSERVCRSTISVKAVGTAPQAIACSPGSIVSPKSMYHLFCITLLWSQWQRTWEKSMRRNKRAYGSWFQFMVPCLVVWKAACFMEVREQRELVLLPKSFAWNLLSYEFLSRLNHSWSQSPHKSIIFLKPISEHELWGG